jgi:hypothetical protein
MDLNETRFYCNACGLPCILIVMDKDERKYNEIINGYCALDKNDVPTAWFKLKPEGSQNEFE